MINLDILEKRGTKAAITDFSILLGAYVSDYHIDNDSSLEGRTGYYWTKSDDGDNDAHVVYEDGRRTNVNVFRRTGGARPSFTRSHQSAQFPRTERVGKEQEMVCLK